MTTEAEHARQALRAWGVERGCRTCMWWQLGENSCQATSPMNLLTECELWSAHPHQLRAKELE